MATSRAGGVHISGAFAGDTRIHGRSLGGGVHVLAVRAGAGRQHGRSLGAISYGLGVVVRDARLLAGGVHVLALRAGSAKGAALFGASRAGGAHLLALRAGAARIGAVPAVQHVGSPRAGGVHALARRASATRLSVAPGGPNTPPAIANQVPAPGSTITKLTAITFDVVDTDGFLFVEIQVDQLRREVAHDGDGFLQPYTDSTRTVITNGWHYSIIRDNGWVVGPVFHVRMFDSKGAAG